MQAIQRVASNTSILYVRMAVTVFISLYATRLVLKALGAEDFGLFNVIGGAIAMLTFLNSAMASATQRFMSFAHGEGNIEKLKNIFNVSIVLHIAIATVIFILFEVVGYFLFSGILKIPEERIEVAQLIFQFMIISTLFTIISVPYDAVINANENMLIYAVIGIVEALSKLGIAVYISHTSFDKLEAFGLLMAVLSVSLLLIRRIYCHYNYAECRIDFQKYFNKPLFKEMTSFASWSFLGSSTGMMANYGQVIILNMFFGPLINAAQAIASQVSGQLGALSTNLLKALNPLIDKSEGGGNRSLMLKAAMAGSKFSFFLLMFLYVPVLIEMPYIFKAWLNDVPEYAILFCRLLLVRNLIEQLFLTLSSSIAAVGNIRKYQIYQSALNFMPIIISFTLFKLNYPSFTLYIIFIIYSLVSSALTLSFASKNCDLSIPGFLRMIVFRCVVLFTIILGLSFLPALIMQESILRLLLVVIINTVSFPILVWFAGLSLDERMGVLQILNSQKLLRKNTFSKVFSFKFNFKLL